MNRVIGWLEAFLEWGGVRRSVACLVVGGVALALSLAGLSPAAFDWAWVAIVLCGVPIILEAFIGLVTAFDIKADVLVSLALIASVLVGEDFAAGEVAFIMQLGALLEDLTVAKARAGIERLVRLAPQMARRVVDGREEVVSVDDVRVSDRLRVNPGETIPVDGLVVQGETAVDQSTLTGESLPVDKGVGDEVMSGTINQSGVFEMTATRVGEDSSFRRLVRLVQSADAGKAKIVHLADRWATWIVVIALVSAGGTWLVTGEILRAVTILVVFCPCALVLATPTAIMAAIGNATRHGCLVKEGDALERLAGLTRLAFDKTGTLTQGRLKVTDVRPATGGLSADELLARLAQVEGPSVHPIGKAIVNAWRAQVGSRVEAARVDDFRMFAGKGVMGRVNGKLCLAGTAAFLAQEGVALPADTEGAHGGLGAETIVHVAQGGVYLGSVSLADTPRAEAASVMASLAEAGVATTLLTGDRAAAANSVASAVGISDVVSECLPEDKLVRIADYQKKGEAIGMLGDGVNDAPALKASNVGIAMGGMGSDVAIDAADIVLVKDELVSLPHLLTLSRRMMRTIRCNLAFSMALNFAAIALAMTGWLNPVVGVLVHNAGSVVVIVNSALLLRWRK